MKRTNFWLLLLGIGSIAVINSCKGDEIDPIENLLGYYFGAVVENIKLEKKQGNSISIKATRVLYKRGISSNGGWEDYYKDYEFPNCEIIIKDTVLAIASANANQTQFYAKIINKDNNTVFGDITKWDSYQTVNKQNYYLLRLNNIFPFMDSLYFSHGYTKYTN
jgi:hypothetical protein